MHEPHESAFQSILEANPCDWATRCVFADWLEEQGRIGQATAQRWMAEFQKAPFKWHRWWWWIGKGCERFRQLQKIETRVLPSAVAAYLPESDRWMTKQYKFKSRKAAEYALAKALKKLQHKTGSLPKCTRQGILFFQG